MIQTSVIGLAIGLAIGLFLSACSPAPTPQQTEAQPSASAPAALESPLGSPPVASSPTAPNSTAPPAALLEAVKAALSEAIGVPADQIAVKSVEAVDWNDSCLGLAGSDEVCLMVITPGYRIKLATPTQEYEFHTDRQRNFRQVKE